MRQNDRIIRKPKGKGPFPAVVFVPGFGMDMHEYKRSFDEISKRLSDQNFVTMQFSFSGVNYKEGIVRELPLSKRAQELEAAFDFVRSRPSVDPKRVGILAQSFGVPTALWANLCGASMIFVSGVYTLRGQFRSRLERDKDFKETRRRGGKTEFIDHDGKAVVVDEAFWQTTEAFNPIEKARRLTEPTLIVHGDQDSYTPVEEVRGVFASLGSTNKKLKIFTGGDHGIIDVPRPMREEMLWNVVEWFHRTL